MITCISAAEERRKKWLDIIRKRLFDNVDKWTYLIPDLSNIVNRLFSSLIAEAFNIDLSFKQTRTRICRFKKVKLRRPNK